MPGKWNSLDERLLAIADPLVLEDRPISVNEVGYDGDTPLHVAAVWGDVQAIEMLVAAGARIDARGEMDATPLYIAVGQGHLNAVRRLLELGASPHIRSEFGTTPEEYAREKGPEFVTLFEQRRT